MGIQSVITRTVTVAAGRFAPGHLGELTQLVPFEMVDEALARTCLILKVNLLLNWGNATTGMVLVATKVIPLPALIDYHQHWFPLVRHVASNPGAGSWECPGQRRDWRAGAA